MNHSFLWTTLRGGWMLSIALVAPYSSPSAKAGCANRKSSIFSVAAINLNRGELMWAVPNGDGPRNHPLLRDLKLPALGQPGRVGPLLTKTLLFAGEGDPIAAVNPPGGGGTKFRAYDKASGAVLWETDLGAGTTGSPMTYALNGRQFIVVAVGAVNHPAELVALALP